MQDTIRNGFSGSERMLYLRGYFPDHRTLSQAPQWEDAELGDPNSPDPDPLPCAQPILVPRLRPGIPRAIHWVCGVIEEVSHQPRGKSIHRSLPSLNQYRALLTTA